MRNPPSYEVEVVTEPGDRLKQVADEWSTLAARHGRDFYASPAYSLSWWSHLGSGQLAVVCVRRNGKLVGLAPLHHRKLAGMRHARLLGHGLGTIGEILVADDDAATRLWDFLAEDGAPLQLTHVRTDSAAILALRRHPAWDLHCVVDDRCPLVQMPPGSIARDLRTQRSLRQFTRHRTALEKAGTPFGIEVIVDLEGLTRRWDDIVRVAAIADAGTGRQNLFAAPWVGFTRAFLQAEAEDGNLLIVGATAGGQWMAQDVGIRRGPVLAQWVSRFDSAFSRQSPGHLIQEWLANHHDELGIDTIDALLGENAFKLAWANGGYDVATVIAAPRRLGLARASLATYDKLRVAARRVIRR